VQKKQLKTSKMKKDLSKSISEHEGWKWTSSIPSIENDSYLVCNLYELHDKPIVKMDLSDIRFMISQNVGLEYLVPLAIEKLTADIFLEATFYEGDLLFALLTIINLEPNYWHSHLNQKQDLINLFESNKKNLKKLKTTSEIRKKINDAFTRFISE
jgi:CDI immunity proteins